MFIIHDTYTHTHRDTETHATQHAALLLLGLPEAEGLARQVRQAWQTRDMKYLDLGPPWAYWDIPGPHPFLNMKTIEKSQRLEFGFAESGVTSTFACFRRSFGLVAIQWPCVCSQAPSAGNFAWLGGLSVHCIIETRTSERCVRSSMLSMGVVAWQSCELWQSDAQGHSCLVQPSSTTLFRFYMILL